MKKADKNLLIEELKDKITSADHFYVTDSSSLTVAAVNDFRRKCFENDIEFKVAKNTLLKKALDACEDNYENLYEQLHGPTAIMFTSTANAPAKVLKEFRKNHEKPVLKAAVIDNEVLVGDEQIKYLSELKSKEELIGDVIMLLQSPVKNVVSALTSGGGKLAGILKTLSEKPE